MQIGHLKHADVYVNNVSDQIQNTSAICEEQEISHYNPYKTESSHFQSHEDM